jgi:hypothetical protein
MFYDAIKSFIRVSFHEHLFMYYSVRWLLEVVKKPLGESNVTLEFVQCTQRHTHCKPLLHCYSSSQLCC